MNKYILAIIVIVVVIIIYKYYNTTTKNKNKNNINPKLKKNSKSNINNINNINNEFDNLLKTNDITNDSIYNENLLNIEFIPSEIFKGKKNNYVFKIGEFGIGYYLDTNN